MREVHSSPGYDLALRTAVDSELHRAIADVEPAALRTAVAHALEGGKRIRPILTMVACAAAGGREHDALPAAAAFELLHTASLVHDDIMDGSELRRGRETVHHRFGLNTAILAGDTMIGLAFRAIQSVPPAACQKVLEIFTGAFLLTCHGQGYDLTLSAGTLPEERLHRSMVEKKTAKLLEACAGVGAVLGNADTETVLALRRFAHGVGMAYQIRDDILDASGQPALTGKPAGQDARNGRATYLRLLSSESPSGSAEANPILAMIEAYTSAARSSLERLPAHPAREYLKDLAGALASRVA